MQIMVMDTTCFTDGEHATSKRFRKSVHPHGVDIGLYFTSGTPASHTANHRVPIYKSYCFANCKTTPTSLFRSRLSFVLMQPVLRHIS